MISGGPRAPRCAPRVAVSERRAIDDGLRQDGIGGIAGTALQSYRVTVISQWLMVDALRPNHGRQRAEAGEER
jgi:hypothetical protein